MQSTTINAARRSGWAAVAAGPLLMLSSGIELIHPVQRPDGTVVEPVTFGVLVGMFGLGMLCVMAAVSPLARLHREAGAGLSRRGRVGMRLELAGGALLVLFALLVAVSSGVSGKPWEAAFVLFAVGFLLLVVGGTLLGFGVRRARVVRGAAVPLWIGAASVLTAIVVPSDPWHDLALFAFDGTWTALGVLLLRHGHVPATGTLNDVTSAASPGVKSPA